MAKGVPGTRTAASTLCCRVHHFGVHTPHKGPRCFCEGDLSHWLWMRTRSERSWWLTQKAAPAGPHPGPLMIADKLFHSLWTWAHFLKELNNCLPVPNHWATPGGYCCVFKREELTKSTTDTNVFLQKVSIQWLQSFQLQTSAAHELNVGCFHRKGFEKTDILKAPGKFPVTLKPKGQCSICF